MGPAGAVEADPLSDDARGVLLGLEAMTVYPLLPGAELEELVQRIAERIGRVLEQRGLIERDMENAWLSAPLGFLRKEQKVRCMT